MITIPVYELLLLPEVTFFFKKDMFPEGRIKEQNIGEEILFVLQKKEIAPEEISMENIFPVGVMGIIENIDEEGSVKITTRKRVQVTHVEYTDGMVQAEAVDLPDIQDISPEEEKEKFDKIKKELMDFAKGFQWGVWVRSMIYHWKSYPEAVSALAGYMSLSWEEKYHMIEVDSRKERMHLMEEAVYELMEIFRVSEEAETAQKNSNEKVYRESAIRKQIEFLQQQLDEMHPENISDVRRFQKKIQESGMNEEARKEAEKVLNRMKQEGKDSHEYGMLYDYLDFATSLSWKTEEPAEIDLNEAEEILNEDHYGLKKVKERIIQQLAVMALNKKQSGSILLFVGAPGTGKTSIGQSIARALHRKYVRISLGGIRDEAEIRGHRRTYIGAMPGRIMEGMKRSGAANPVMVLDEVDKLAKDYGGDPASALLEVLDPEQNGSFTDHYMNVPYDLSNVLFVCTANSTDTIPEPLLNRMEVIQFPGYTAVEKFQIARRHLLPKAMKSMGIKAQNLKVTDEAIRRIIEEYTAEAGVRGLKKQMDVLCRYAAVKLVKGEQKSITVSEKRVAEFLGHGIHHEKILENPVPGVVTGLAWTSAGGEILFIETSFTKGDGKVIITGQLGDVMKESAQAGISYIRSVAERYGIKPEFFKEHDLHIHIPEGAVPKDGPSAGITMATAMLSAITGRAVRANLAMTGEITLRGRVLPIGGLKEKMLAAKYAGITKILVPDQNRPDVEEIDGEIKDDLTIVFVEKMEQVLKEALV